MLRVKKKTFINIILRKIFSFKNKDVPLANFLRSNKKQRLDEKKCIYRRRK